MHVLENSYPILNAYCDWVRRQSPTSVDEFCVASGLSVMAACIGPTRKTPFGDGLSHYFVLVAGSGVGKRAPTVCAAKVVRDINPMLTTDRDPSSANGLLTRLQQQPGIIYTMQEFGSWFESICQSQGTSQRQIATSFLKLWDCPSYIEGFDNKKEADSMSGAAFPVVSILANMTNDAWLRVSRLKGFKHDGLGGRFEPIIVSPEEERMLDQGRLKLSTVEDTDVEPAPLSVLEVIAKAARYTLEDICKAERHPRPEDPNQNRYSNIVYRPRIPFGITEDAREHVEHLRSVTFHQKWKFDGIAEHIIARKMARVIRTACLLCSFDSREIVNKNDIDFAHLFHTENFDKAAETYRLGFKEDVLGVIEETIISALRDRKMMKWSELCKIKAIKGNNTDVLLKVKRSMICSGKITSEVQKTIGRPAEWLTLAEEEESSAKINFTVKTMPDDEAFLR